MTRQPALVINFPKGTKQFTADGYQSETVARSAAKQMLADFLSDLLREEKRK
jgi:hypothetical protein